MGPWGRTARRWRIGVSSCALLLLCQTGIGAETGTTSATLRISVTIAEQARVERRDNGDHCLRQRPRSLPVHIITHPDRDLTACDAQSLPARRSQTADSEHRHTVLITPI